jgi:hypothetical protein
VSIKISDISNILLQDPQNKKWDKKYIDGLIKEQLAVLDYKKTFPQGLNEQDEDKDELVPIGDEEEVINVEPEVEPETIPVPPEKPITPEIEKKQAEYTTISKEQARELLSFKGKIFQAVFTKRGDGSLRALNGMSGVRKYTSGGELPYSPKDKGLVPVYDLKIGNGAKGYRMLNLDGLKTLNMDGKKYKIDPYLKENMKRSELKEIIKEVVRSTQPQRVAPERETITKPETDTPERKPKRRTLTPPTEAPETKPKAEGVIKENEQDIANKIASRFQKLGGKELDENFAKGALAALLMTLGTSYAQLKPETQKQVDQISLNPSITPQEKSTEIEKIIHPNQDDKRHQNFLDSMKAAGFKDELLYKRYLKKIGKKGTIERLT